MHNSPTGQSRIAIPCGASLPFLYRFNPDVIHTQSPFGAGLEALLASRVLGVPLVGTNHTPIEEFVHYSPVFGNRSALFARKYFAWYYNRCVFMTAPYQGLIDRMRQVGLKVEAQAVVQMVQQLLVAHNLHSLRVKCTRATWIIRMMHVIPCFLLVK